MSMKGKYNVKIKPLYSDDNTNAVGSITAAIKNDQICHFPTVADAHPSPPSKQIWSKTSALTWHSDHIIIDPITNL